MVSEAILDWPFNVGFDTQVGPSHSHGQYFNISSQYQYQSITNYTILDSQ